MKDNTNSTKIDSKIPEYMAILLLELKNGYNLMGNDAQRAILDDLTGWLVKEKTNLEFELNKTKETKK